MPEESNRTKSLVHLFLLSALSLYIELLIIRWMSADIRAFTVFRTFPLVTCFVALGVGFALNSSKAYKLLPWASLAFATIMEICDYSRLGYLGFPSLANFQWQNLVGITDDPTVPYLVFFVLLIVVLLAGPFAMCAAIGSRLGVLFNEHKPIVAYSVNVGGALFGSILFPCLCALRFAPWQLLAGALVAFSICSFVFDKQKDWKNLVVAAVIAAIFFVAPHRSGKALIPVLYDFGKIESSTIWSPYQRIDLTVISSKREPDSILGLEISANRAFYQYFFDPKNIENESINKERFLQNVHKDYSLPFKISSPESALIVGAGTGQNVYSALEAGVKRIDAVEIDPVILDIGKRYNTAYKNPAVNAICDDARHFISTTDKKYDLINFATLDSHAVTGMGSSVRIDSYIYTKECIEKSLSLLTPQGHVVVSFVGIAPWVGQRLYNTFSAAAGYPPLAFEGKMIGTVFILGEDVRNGTLQVPEGYQRGDFTLDDDVRILTDDWPYLYLNPKVVDYPYLIVVAEILLISVFASRKFLFTRSDALSWQMFFLGSAFMLLELHAISFLSLLYGSTWITAGIVINSILLMILLANYVISKNTGFLLKHSKLVYLGLAGSIILSYCLPVNSLLAMTGGGRHLIYALISIVTILPMGFAALIFGSFLTLSVNPARAIAFNLFGAVIGGLLEYLSNYFGIRNMEIVAAALYFCSMIAGLKALKSTNQEAPVTSDEMSVQDSESKLDPEENDLNG